MKQAAARVIVGCLVLMGGVQGAEASRAQVGPPDAHFPFDMDVPEMTESGSTLEFVLVGELGVLDGDGALGRIRDVAVSGDSIAAVLDELGCLIHRFDLPDGTYRDALGRCGDGPGEMRQPISIAYLGDTLVVSDWGKRRILFLDGEGEEIQSQPYPSELETAPVAQIDARDGLVLWQPTWLGASPERDMLLVDRQDGNLEGGLPDPEISFRHPDTALARTAGGICAFRDAPQIAVSNGWALELVILDSALDPVHRHCEDDEDLEPEPVPPEYGGGWSSGFLSTSGLACSDSTALWAFRRHSEEAREAGELRLEKAYHFLATAGGVMLGKRVVEDTAWPDVAAQVPAAAYGNRFLFYQNNWGPYPTVRIYEVTSGTEDVEGR